MNESGISRRDVLATVAATLALPVLAGNGVRLLADDGDAPVADASGWLKTIKPADFKTSYYMALAKTNKLILALDGTNVYAYSSICTHKGCIVGAKEIGLICPCHQAQYEITGAVKAHQKARRDLPRYALRLNADGVIEVNTAKAVTADDASATLVVKDPGK